MDRVIRLILGSLFIFILVNSLIACSETNDNLRILINNEENQNYIVENLIPGITKDIELRFESNKKILLNNIEFDLLIDSIFNDLIEYEIIENKELKVNNSRTYLIKLGLSSKADNRLQNHSFLISVIPKKR